MAVATATKKYAPEQIIASYDSDEISKLEALRNDPVLFCQMVCGIEPNAKQAEFLRLPWQKNLSAMLAWGRQFGKSLAVAILITWLLFSERRFSAFVFAPAGSQARAIFDRIISFYQTAPLLRELPKKIKGEKLTVGDPDWGSSVELVRVGLTGDLGRSRSTKGKGLCVWDEFSHFLFPKSVLQALSPITASGGSQILLSSPGDPGSAMHDLYLDWTTLQTVDPTYAVIDCDIADTTHLSPEWIEKERRKYKTLGAEWMFEREILGRWIAPANTWFAHEDIERCTQEPIKQGSSKDLYCWSYDPGGRGNKSAFVICISRFNQAKNRLEVVDLRSFQFENHRYKRNDTGSEEIENYAEVLEIFSALRQQYPPTWVGYDPNTERALSEQVENLLRMPTSAITIGSYTSKLRFLEDLRRCIAEKKILWHDRRITDQLKAYCPSKDENTGKWNFPEKNADIVMCLGMLYHYLGERECRPFAVISGGTCEW